MRYFFLLSILFLTGCEESYKAVFEQNREKDESVRLYKFMRQSADRDGRTQWILEAEEAYIYQERDQESRIIAYNFHFKQYDVNNGKILSDLTSGRGVVDYTEKKLILSKGVTFRESATNYITSESMEYNLDTKLITSSSEVTIVEGTRKTLCKNGVEIDREKEKEICRSPNVFQQSRQGSDDAFTDLFDK